MTVIKQADLIESIADALQYISYYHPKDFIDAVNAAYQRELNPAAKDAMAQILINSRMCATGQRPICQDTGIVSVFLKIGMDIQWDAELSVDEMVNQGVRQAYLHPDNKLRASILADPDGARKNTGDNTPAVVSYDLVPGNKLEVYVVAKGGGSANKSFLFQETKALLNPAMAAPIATSTIAMANTPAVALPMEILPTIASPMAVMIACHTVKSSNMDRKRPAKVCSSSSENRIPRPVWITIVCLDTMMGATTMVFSTPIREL